MTLCAVWQNAQGLHLAADSRLSGGENYKDYADTPVKVTAIPIQVAEPVKAGDDRPQAMWQQQLGFCAAGDIVPTMTTKETLRLLLPNLRAMPGMAQVSMDECVAIICTVFESLWLQSMKGFGDDMRGSIAVAGYCPQQDRARAFLLETEAIYAAKVIVREIEASPHPMFFGSGTKPANALLQEDPSLSPLEIIRRIANDQAQKGIGGRVQYGRVVDRDFRVFAVYDHDVDEKTKTFTTGFHSCGVRLLDPTQLRLPEGYDVLSTAIDLFKRDREDLIAKGYCPVTQPVPELCERGSH